MSVEHEADREGRVPPQLNKELEEKHTMEEIAAFSTTDIVLAAYLKCAGYKMTEIQKKGSQGTFVFPGVPDEVIMEYDLGRAVVEPRALNQEIRALSIATRR